MTVRLLRYALAALTLALFAAFAFPDEGMWLLTQLDKLPFAEMKKHGLELSPAQIYDPAATSIKDAIVLLPGGTGSFVSADGLIITNHHIAFGAIRSVSSVEDDYLKNGFSAATHPDEIPVPSYSAQIVASIKDVTADVLSGVTDDMAPEARTKAIQQKTEEIRKAAAASTGLTYSVSETFNGVRYYLYGYQVLPDVRLVYAPPSAIGNYGGEVDNWMWPRHTGDFGFMRAYTGPDGKPAKYSKDNIPFHPKAFLPVSSKPLDEHSFAMIMGFPGRTFRYRTSPEIKLQKEESLPLTIDLYTTRMAVMEAGGKNNRAVELKYASSWRSLANAEKNYQGTLEGMVRSDLLNVRQAEEKELAAFLHGKPELEQKYGSVIAEIGKAYDDLKSYNKKQIVLGQIYSSSAVFGMAQRFSRYAAGFVKDSATGEMKPTEQASSALKTFVADAFKDVDLNVDRLQFEAMLLKAEALPQGERIAAVDRIGGENALREYVDDLYKHTALGSTEGCQKLMTKNAGEILDDDFIKFLKQLDEDNKPIQEKGTAFAANIGRLRGKLLEAMMAWKGPDLYPDANRSLRITYGEIKSYDPRDAVHYDYETTLGGAIAKETGEDPFIVPKKLHDLWAAKDFGKYADPRLHDVPVAFTANLDITGGNSGSPVINGKGELIGVAFDGNWESVVGDYYFQEPLNRSINVDSRYVLFLLDKYSNAQNLLKEMVIH